MSRRPRMPPASAWRRLRRSARTAPTAISARRRRSPPSDLQNQYSTCAANSASRAHAAAVAAVALPRALDDDVARQRIADAGLEAPGLRVPFGQAALAAHLAEVESIAAHRDVEARRDLVAAFDERRDRDQRLARVAASPNCGICHVDRIASPRTRNGPRRILGVAAERDLLRRDRRRSRRPRSSSVSLSHAPRDADTPNTMARRRPHDGAARRAGGRRCCRGTADRTASRRSPIRSTRPCRRRRAPARRCPSGWC